jgi:DNA polymerase III delta subunit
VSCPDELITSIFERCGTSMFTLAAEIDKLSFYARSHGRNAVTKEDIPLVTCATIETDAFALANSLLDGKNAKALEALAVMKYNRVDPVIVLSEISRVISDLALVKALSSAGKTAFEINNLLKMRSEYKVKVYIAGAASKSEEKLASALELCAEADRLLKRSGGGYDLIEQLLSTI